MPHARADRDLLFGILALQNNFITRDQLLTAFNAWVVDKSRPIAEILQGQKALSENVRTLLDALAQQHIAQHGGDAEKSLAAVSSLDSIRQDLAKIADSDLQASVGRLPPLPQGEGRGEGLDSRVSDAHATAAPNTIGMPTSTGLRFRILRPHAKGGLGEVFVASDEELHRQVALKQIQEGRAHDAESRARFLLEAEITGGLEHPGIVPVYGLGTYADGRPFYAMRFVRGDSLKEAIARFHKKPNADYADGRREESQSSLCDNPRNLRLDFSSVDFRKLLGRFLDVCNAIQYAHDRGVLHRDLKPGNIMLGPYGETLVVDWGLAKAAGSQKAGGGRQKAEEAGEPAHTSPPLTKGGQGGSNSGEPPLIPQSGSGVAETQAGSAIGTPQYMSPEQAAGRLDLLGPASDVYSLGATLYSLLTGKAPFDEDDPGSLLRKVERGDFPSPRSRNPAIPRALEAICQKAMATKAEDRYPTPRRLADDVERWLADEPVRAWPEPWTVKARRWMGRHRTLVTTGVAVLVVSAIGLGVGLAITSGFNQELERRRAALAGAHADLQASFARERDERKRAEENEKTAKEREAETQAVLDFVEKKIFAAAIYKGQKGGLGPNVTVREAVESGLPDVEKSFTKQPLIEARVRNVFGVLFSYLGDPKIALEQFQASCVLYTNSRGPDHPDTLRSMNNVAITYDDLGQYPEALKLQQKTLAMREAKLGPDHPDTLASMHNLANNYSHLGRHEDALKLREEALALRRVKLGPDHADTLRSIMNLAVSYAALGRRAEALKLREQVLAIQKASLGPGHPDTLLTIMGLASSYYTSGQYAEAHRLQEEALPLQKASLGPDHPDTLRSMGNLALSLVKLDRGAEALPIIDACLKRAVGKAVYPGLVPGLTELRLRHFAKLKDAQGCRTTTEMWEKLERTDGTSLYNAARMRAVTAGVIKVDPKTPAADAARLAKEEADRAMVWLQQAVVAGYNNVAQMRKDTDLDALREREDFRKLVAELEAKKK